MQTQESGFSLAAAFQRNCSKQLLRSHFQNQAWIPFRSFLLFFHDWASNGSITFDCLASLRSCATSINYLRASEINASKSNLPFTTVLTALLNQRDLKRDLKKTHRVEGKNSLFSGFDFLLLFSSSQLTSPFLLLHAESLQIGL